MPRRARTSWRRPSRPASSTWPSCSSSSRRRSPRSPRLNSSCTDLQGQNEQAQQNLATRQEEITKAESAGARAKELEARTTELAAAVAASEQRVKTLTEEGGRVDADLTSRRSALDETTAKLEQTTKQVEESTGQLRGLETRGQPS